ncbi:glycosyltransferase [Pseudoalteromonas sp. SCSIO 43095]|uniref:glycosyltransferase family 2 protein n=1 Tax=Pseudoalteromonas sp. SCSIO 43095 TaxID=2894202 RepID=UPI00202B22D1|nr:glycosyltransferase family 2 protein [Pseudoalteromonas sp. SCSIO 43095]URQ99017.1 glycosyltransferase [Pseudoalteromonas sp. SCSIO 43095]
MLSIIIPHYNSPDLLYRLIKSIGNYRDIEIIIVDDNSTKPYKREELSDYSNIVNLVNNTNVKGAGVCRNIGLAASNGEWVLFADADDVFLPGYYSIVASYFKEDGDIVFFPPTSHNLSGTACNRHVKYALLLESDDLNHVGTQFIVPWSKLYRRDSIKSIKFDETLVSNDVMFSLRAYCNAKKIVISEKKIYSVCGDAGGLSRPTNKRHFTRLDVAIRANKFLKLQNLRKYQHPLIFYILTSIKFGYRCLFSTVVKILKSKSKIFPESPLRYFYNLFFYRIK